MSIDRSEAARQVAIATAMQSRRPLHFWPGDEHSITLRQLPDVSREFLQLHPPRRERELVVSSSEKPLGLTVGASYAIIRQEYRRGSGVIAILGVWHGLDD